MKLYLIAVSVISILLFTSCTNQESSNGGISQVVLNESTEHRIEQPLIYDRSSYSDVVNDSIDNIISLPDVKEILVSNDYRLEISEGEDTKRFIRLEIMDDIYTIEDFQFKIYEDGTIMRWYSEARSFLELIESIVEEVDGIS